MRSILCVVNEPLHELVWFANQLTKCLSLAYNSFAVLRIASYPYPVHPCKHSICSIIVYIWRSWGFVIEKTTPAYISVFISGGPCCRSGSASIYIHALWRVFRARIKWSKRQSPGWTRFYLDSHQQWPAAFWWTSLPQLQARKNWFHYYSEQLCNQPFAW